MSSDSAWHPDCLTQSHVPSVERWIRMKRHKTLRRNSWNAVSAMRLFILAASRWMERGCLMKNCQIAGNVQSATRRTTRRKPRSGKWNLGESLTSEIPSKFVLLLHPSKICLLKTKLFRKSHLKISLTDALVWEF